MNAYVSTASLLLLPQQPHWHSISLAALAQLLRDIGLIADIISVNDADSYYAGDAFLDHIAFMGCAPTLRFAPDAEFEKFTHVRLHRFDAITALVGTNTAAPRCPHCKQACTQWRTLLAALNNPHQWQCAHCAHNAAPWQYHWRKSAGFARVCIEITDIYPKEALPQSSLIETLEAACDTAWQYCYRF